MTGIGGVRMWMEDFLINSSSYSKDYRRDFIKVKDFWNECVKAFKECKSIGGCNNNYDLYEEKLDELRSDLYKIWGNKLPLGIADTLDYMEEAVGELEDKYIDNLINKGGKFTIVLPNLAEPNIPENSDLKDLVQWYKKDYPLIDFEIKNNKIQVSGDFYDVRSFLEEEFLGYGTDLVAEGVFENA